MTSAISTRKILITGARGFIGGELLTRLKNSGYNVVGITEDIRDKQSLAPHFKDVEFVINAAVKAKKNIPNPEIYYQINVLGTKNVVELCLENNTKLIHLSSIDTEGPYGVTKQLSQQLVEEYAKNNNLETVILRLCVIYNTENNTKRPGPRFPIEKLANDIENLINSHDFKKFELIDYEKHFLLHLKLLNNRMKNLLVYISPNHKFNPEHELMCEVQIDNSLDFWQKEDILLLTNFPYEYHGVKSIVAPENLINKSFETNPRGIINSKINAIIYLLENKIIIDQTWFHDFDSFQLLPLDLPEITGDLGVVCYGIYPENRLRPLGKNYEHRVNFGNVFFKPQSVDIFKLLLTKMDETGLYEEDAMTVLLGENTNNIKSRIDIMNQTYNIGLRCVRSNIAIADKPIRVAHFPPNDERVLHKFTKILPPKLGAMLKAKFSVPESIRYLQGLKFHRERRLWDKFMQRYNCQRIVEIGVHQGENFRRMIEHKPELAVAVDAWLNDGVAARNDVGYSQEKLDQIYEQFKLDMASRPNVQIYKEYTFDAAKHFPDGYFDLIYIDGDHSYVGCSKDLEAWYPKVKHGGFLTGDDYNDYRAPVTGVVFEVVQAVNEFASRENLNVYELPSHGWAIIK